MKFFDYEMGPVCPIKINTIWEYNGKENIFVFNAGLVLQNFDTVNQLWVFKGYPKLGFTTEQLQSDFTQTDFTANEHLLHNLVSIDFNKAEDIKSDDFSMAMELYNTLNNLSSPVKFMGGGGVPLFSQNNIMDILFAGIRISKADDKASKHAEISMGLNRLHSDYQIVLNESKTQCIPQTIGIWYVVYDTFLAPESKVHCYISENEAKAIAAYYEKNCDSYTSYKAKEHPFFDCRTDIDGKIIPRSLGSWNVYFQFGSDDRKTPLYDYGMMFDEAISICHHLLVNTKSDVRVWYSVMKLPPNLTRPEEPPTRFKAK